MSKAGFVSNGLKCFRCNHECTEDNIVIVWNKDVSPQPTCMKCQNEYLNWFYDERTTKILNIHKFIQELKKDYQGKSENQYVVQKLEKILGIWNI